MIVLGRILAPFGIKGWLKIHPFGDDPLAWGEMPKWWIAPEDQAPAEQWTAHKLRECQAHGKGLVARLDGIADRTAAEALAGWYIAAPREALPRTEGEFYWDELIGLTVRNEAGESLGEVTGLLSTGAHDVLQVQDGEVERLIPYVDAYVQEIDLSSRSIRSTWQKDW
jgi:16S rRNA processing protein RimM